MAYIKLKEDVLLFINRLIESRDRARENQDYIKADSIKVELAVYGIKTQDGNNGNYQFASRIPVWIIDWDSMVAEQLSDGYISSSNVEYFAKRAITDVVHGTEKLKDT